MKESNPLYQQIYNAIKLQIENNEYSAGVLLPSEIDLQKQFDVSRITVRRALQELEIAGLVRRVHGKGTFVETKKPYSNLGDPAGFSTEATRTGERASSIILEFKEEQANMIVSEYLQIPANSTIYFLKRLRLKNGRIIGLNETYISKLPGLNIDASEIDENTSIYSLYQEKHFNIIRATETIEAKMPTKSLRNELFIRDETPIFLRERITYVQGDVPIEFSVNTYKSDEYKYVINLTIDNNQ